MDNSTTAIEPIPDDELLTSLDDNGTSEADSRARWSVCLQTAEDVTAHIHQTCELLRSDANQVFEVRAFDCRTAWNNRTCDYSGFYDDVATLAKDVMHIESQRPTAVYITLNPVKRDCLCWADNVFKPSRQGHSATDAHILKRSWVLIDVDPVRLANIMATVEEIEYARDVVRNVRDYLHAEHNWTPDMETFSGNGFHLLYRADMPNDPTATARLQALLNDLAKRCDDPRAKVDVTVYNASRITKLYGTMVRKGDAVAKLGRLHRRSFRLERGVL